MSRRPTSAELLQALVVVLWSIFVAMCMGVWFWMMGLLAWHLGG